MRRPISLTLRLTLLFGFVAGIVLSGFGFVIERSIDHHFRTGDVDEMEFIASAVSHALTTPDTADNPLALKQRFSDTLVGHHGALLYVTGRDGRILFSSPGGPDLASIDHSVSDLYENDSVRRWSHAGHTYRILTRRVGDNASPEGELYTVSVAVTIDNHLQFFDSFRHTLWLMIASGIVMTGLMGWFAVRQGHAPLRSIVARIRRISANELNIRLQPEAVPRELTDLAVTFNDMLERMEQSFQRLSNYSADIAHELRTPVTSLLTQSQVALSQSRTVDEYREILYSNIEEYEHMAQMIGDMLFLAKADNGLYDLGAANIDLAREVEDLFEYYEAWADERHVSLVLKDSATIQGDKLMLRRALGNLLSNAIRHTPAGGAVRVRLENLRAKVVIVVENSGDTIPPEHITRLFDRFYRVAPSRQRDGEGAGLGLAIVKSIVDAHGGKIGATSAEGCTRFEISLPRPTAEAH